MPEQNETSTETVLNETINRLTAREKELIKEYAETKQRLTNIEKELADINQYIKTITNLLNTNPASTTIKHRQRNKCYIVNAEQTPTGSYKIQFSSGVEIVISMDIITKVVDYLKKQSLTKPIYITQMAKELDISISSVHHTLKLLEYKGYIKKDGKMIQIITQKTQPPPPEVESIAVHTAEQTNIIKENNKALQTELQARNLNR